ncbi:hypothetical protein N7535_008267 [Penicillium sp. DV-2018c]|nr:hypothetical protein N7461_004306 [Penicillium sp. DV-2018c]KAJ5566629.1 hypothetical protein N7535_008267 [Penicillium sp. DV-2018c]
MRPIPPTLSVSPRTVISAKQFQFQPQFQGVISDAIHQAREFHELVVTDVPQGWRDFLWEADEPLLSHTRLSYDPKTCTLRLSIMLNNLYSAQFYKRPISRVPKAPYLMFPHLAVESGFSESYDDLNGDIQAVILEMD